jgi:hypothetical protein
MGGKVWSSEELDTLELLAGDVPWPALPQVYWNTVRQHGYPRRTGTALRRKCNDLGLQRAAIGKLGQRRPDLPAHGHQLRGCADLDAQRADSRQAFW